MGGMSMSVSRSRNLEARARLPLPGQTRTGRVDSNKALDHEATSDAAKIFRALNLLAGVWWLMLLASTAVLVVFAWFTPGVAFFNNPSARDAEIQSIKSVTDVGLLQNKAILDISEGSASSANATFLCQIALGALLFFIIGSIGGLLLIRWMKRHMSPVGGDD